VRLLLDNAARSFVRTSRHPSAQGLRGAESLDHLYEASESFEQVYASVVETLVEAAEAQAPEPIIYAVPGSPLVAERTVELLRLDDRVDVTVIPALSFLDLAWARLGIDPIDEGVGLIDAEQFEAQATGTGPFLVAQCWSQALLSDIKLSVDIADDDAVPGVVILHHLGLDDEEVRTVPWWELDRTLLPDHLTSLYIPMWPGANGVEKEAARLAALVATLRAQCPWDRKQTHATLMPHLVEEAYEVLDALEEMDDTSTPIDARAAHLQEELGDLLFQIVFHACLAEEDGQFDLADVARGVHDKLVHRHPHVFGDVVADSADVVVQNWEEIKKQEKGRSSVTEGIPAHLPALLLSTKLQRKALSVGLANRDGDAGAQLAALLSAAESATGDGVPAADATLRMDGDETEQLVGALLFEVANVARQLGIDPEQALRSHALQFRDGIRAAEADSADD
jgi:tetrapyrrole methylase family protein/MazG family protein